VPLKLNTPFRLSSRARVIVVAAVSGACAGSPASPTAMQPISPPAATLQQSAVQRVLVPEPSGQVEQFEFDAVLLHGVRDYTRKSRYLLYENGAFILEYPQGQYRGIYVRDGDLVTFRWEGSGEWQASATEAGDRMVVRYNLHMQLSDFEDAIYRRTS
jgi:hypothetical protein